MGVGVASCELRVVFVALLAGAFDWSVGGWLVGWLLRGSDHTTNVDKRFFLSSA
jgi:hypothetical protein